MNRPATQDIRPVLPIRLLHRAAFVALLFMLGSSAALAAGLDGTRWRAHSVAGETPPPAIAPTLDFHDGRVSGRDGCNRYIASVEQSGDALRFGQAAGTRMACPEPQMKLGDAFARVLQPARSMRRSTDTLVLLDADNREIAVFTAMPPQRPKEAKYTCGDKSFVVTTRDADHLVLLADKPVPLARVASATGEKFVGMHDPSTILWYYGDKVLVQWQGARLTPCVGP